MSQKLPFGDKLEAYNKVDGPGLAVLVMQGGKVLFKKGYGLANLETREKITTATNFRLASVSKQYTAMAIAILEEQGKINIDALLNDYFTDFPDCTKDITVSHLIHHMSGLPDYHLEFCGSQKHEKIATNKDIYQFYQKTQKLEFIPGDKHCYNNGNYNLLATLVKKVSGQSFQDFIKQNIFAPAGMTHSAVIDAPEPDIPHQASSYSQWPFFENLDHDSCNNLYGEGGIFSSIDDTARWITALETSKLVSPKMMAKIFTGVHTNEDDTTAYGYGWEMDERYYGHKAHGHAGGWLGFTAHITHFHEHNLWIALYSNSLAIPASLLSTDVTQHYLELEGV